MHAAATGRVSKGGPEGPEGPEGSLPNMLGRRPDGAALGGHRPARPTAAAAFVFDGYCRTVTMETTRVKPPSSQGHLGREPWHSRFRTVFSPIFAESPGKQIPHDEVA